MRKKTKAQQQATKAFEIAIAEARGSGTNRLPALRVLAAKAGVTSGVMQKVVAHQKLKGVISVSPRSGIVLKDSLTIPKQHRSQSIAGQQSKIELVANRISNNIVCSYKPGESLPTMKEMAFSYGVCYRTLKTALDRLVRSGLVEPYKRGFRTRSYPHGQRSTGKVVIIELGYGSGNIPIGSIFFCRSYAGVGSAIEKRCIQQKLQVERIFYRYNQNNELGVAGRKNGIVFLPEELEYVFGFILCTAGLGGLDLSGITEHLLLYRKPVAIIDETGPVEIRVPKRLSHFIRQFNVGTSSKSGELVGNYLIGLGHRRIGYIGDTHEQAWSQNRFRGLEMAYRVAGFENAVIPFVTHSDLWILKQFGDEQKELSKVLEAVLSHAKITKPELKAVLETVGTAGSDVARYATQIIRLYNAAKEETVLHSCMKHALSCKGMTALAGATDTVAVFAQDFFKQHNRRVPQDIAIVGFDATEASSHAKITSYDFNFPAIIEAALEHVLSPVSKKRFRSQAIIQEIDGFIISRHSTAKLLK